MRAVGCTGGTGGLDTNGPRGRKVVALTFDDGPSEYTPGFLQVLREKGVPGTFFEIGQEMPGREATMRQILAEGDEIGDHTMNHVEYPGYRQIGGAATRIEEYTHFKPCLFRPPGGAIDASVLSEATRGAATEARIELHADSRTPGAPAGRWNLRPRAAHRRRLSPGPAQRASTAGSAASPRRRSSSAPEPDVSLFAPLDNSPVLWITLSTGCTTRDTSAQITLAGQSGVLSTKFRSWVRYPDTASTLSRMPSMPARISSAPELI